MRLTTRTNLAMRTLMFCAVNSGCVVRKAEVASVCNVSENHLAQVIHRLAQLGFLHTTRGRSGGLQLGRPAALISVGEVIRAFESAVPFTECMTGGEGTCPLAATCRLKCALAGALEVFYAALDPVTLSDLTEDNDGLRRILCVA